MPRLGRLLSYLVVASCGVMATHAALAFPTMALKTGAACAACHVSPAGGSVLTDAGKTFKADASRLPGSNEGATYVGANKCKMCHSKQFKAWSGTKHASALANMAKADPKAVAEMAEHLKIELKGPAAKNDECVACHVTGFKLAGGYPAPDSTRHANLSMVGCEACHGPGSKHLASTKESRKTSINRAVGASMCMQCHVSAASPNFKFETYKTKVHPIPTQ